LKREEIEVNVSGECRFGDGRQLMISRRYSPKRCKDGGTQWDATWELKWQCQLPHTESRRSFPLHTSSKAVSGEFQAGSSTNGRHASRWTVSECPTVRPEALVNAAASGRTYELDEFVQFCAGGQLPTVPLFIQNASNLLSIENEH
jgi:hypothetical protein